MLKLGICVFEIDCTQTDVDNVVIWLLCSGVAAICFMNW